MSSHHETTVSRQPIPLRPVIPAQPHPAETPFESGPYPLQEAA